ncbi:hypothetical protein ACFSE1_03715 [Rhizobium helianthi]|uniref:Uncharacterized protein n=1 Tax=Rhizobium helianthi TaxID=1132695 RepID=A0ABW4LZE0_9HYPH
MNEARLSFNPKSDPLDERLTALEARIVVLEIVSMSALAMALDTSENADTQAAQGMAGLIVETVDQRCTELGVSSITRNAARDYAQHLLGVAMESLYARPN